MNQRVLFRGAGVIQMCWMAPGPSMVARVKVELPLTRTKGETFQPWPRSRAARHAEPSCPAMAALPFSPLKFSGQIDRDLALERRKRFPRSTSSPLKPPSAARAGERVGQVHARENNRAPAMDGTDRFMSFSHESRGTWAQNGGRTFRRYRTPAPPGIQQICTGSSPSALKNDLEKTEC